MGKKMKLEIEEEIEMQMKMKQYIRVGWRGLRGGWGLLIVQLIDLLID